MKLELFLSGQDCDTYLMDAEGGLIPFGKWRRKNADE